MTYGHAGHVTIGMMRAEGKRLHIICGSCWRDREPRMDTPPFDVWRDNLTVPEISKRKLISCGVCGERQRIWVQTESASATPEVRLKWGWTEDEVKAAGKTMGMR